MTTNMMTSQNVYLDYTKWIRSLQHSGTTGQKCLWEFVSGDICLTAVWVECRHDASGWNPHTAVRTQCEECGGNRLCGHEDQCRCKQRYWRHIMLYLDYSRLIRSLQHTWTWRCLRECVSENIYSDKAWWRHPRTRFAVARHGPPTNEIGSRKKLFISDMI